MSKMGDECDNWNSWAGLANDVGEALRGTGLLFSQRMGVARALWRRGYRNPEDEHWVITELSLNNVQPPGDGQVHPESTPIGPFPTKDHANDWAEALCNAHGGGAWMVSPMRKP